MRKPCKYPRKPTGPSGFGESGVRDMQRNGPQYQRTRPNSDTLSIQSGDFSRVLVDDVPQYLTTGFDGKIIRRDTKRYQQAFLKAATKISGDPVSLSGGLYATVSSSFDTGEESDIEVEYDYEVLPGLTQTVSFQQVLFNNQVRFGGYRTKGELMASYTSFFSYQFPPTSQEFYYKSRDDVAFYGNRENGGRAAVAIGTVAVGRKDSADRFLHDVFIYRMTRRADNDDYLLNVSDFTRPEAEFWPINPVLVLKDYTITILAEIFFRPGPYDSSEDYRPKFWIAATRNDSTFGTFTYSDMTASIFGGARIPDPAGTAPNQYYGVSQGRQYGADLSTTLLTLNASFCVVGDNTFLMSWQQRMPAGWRQRVARVTVDAGTATGTLVYESTDSTNRNLVPFWQSVVHIGEGVVLAKIISGWPDTGFTVAFRRSNDGGVTWADPFTPIGFDAPMLNQFYGSFTVDAPIKDGAPGRVLLPAWNPGTLAYHVYESKDNGVTWERKGRIYKPSEFRRVDTILFGDGGGNFDELIPGPDKKRLPDVTLPNRYKDRP